MLFNTVATFAVLTAGAIAAPSLHHRELHAEKRSEVTPCKISSKRGIAYNAESTFANALKNECGDKCGWSYSWESDTKTFSGAPFIPTLKDSSGLFTSTFKQFAGSLAEGSNTVFSINEPDIESQANLDVGTCVSLHTEYTGPFVGKKHITTPSVSSTDAPNKGLDYLSKWISACNNTPNCHFDSCNVHWYGPVGHEQEFLKYVDAAAAVCGKKIWVTEFGYYDNTASTEQAVNFIKTAVPALDSNDNVIGYSYFKAGAGDQLLCNADGSLNAAGKLYATI